NRAQSIDIRTVFRAGRRAHISARGVDHGRFGDGEGHRDDLSKVSGPVSRSGACAAEKNELRLSIIDPSTVAVTARPNVRQGLLFRENAVMKQSVRALLAGACFPGNNPPGGPLMSLWEKSMWSVP